MFPKHALLLILLALPAQLRAQAEPRGPWLFYHPVEYGSAAVTTPASIFLNRGFSMITISDRYPRDPRDITWEKSFTWVGRTLRNPIDAIELFGGWQRWLRVHFIPFAGVPLDKAGWFPNYVGHIMHGGQSYRYMAEYLQAREAPMPRATAAFLYMSMQLVNETIEQQGHEVIAAATPADLYIFDPAAILLFEIDAVARFFAEDLRAADWSPMPSLTLPNGEIQNNGQTIAYRVRVPGLGRTDALLVIGLSGHLGIMREIRDGHSVGAAAGVAGVERTLDPVTQEEQVDLVMSWGAYWDRDNSLLMSITHSPLAKNTVSVNVYPGVLPGVARHTGVWLVRTREGEWRAGVASSRTLGLGIGFGR